MKGYWSLWAIEVWGLEFKGLGSRGPGLSVSKPWDGETHRLQKVAP